VQWARHRYRANRFVLVGHSAGGLLARLYLHTGSVWGHTYAGVEHVDTIITLGSPHRGFQGWYLSDESNRLVPGTPYADQVHYHVVAGRAVCGLPDGNYRQRRAFRLYSFFQRQGNGWGDGTVPLSSAGLEGVETLILDGIVHSAKAGRNWYGGSQAIVRRWWPAGPDQSVAAPGDG
jgi:pimeloyl-ACP methyl ester carboxylesterase